MTPAFGRDDLRWYKQDTLPGPTAEEHWVFPPGFSGSGLALDLKEMVEFQADLCCPG